MRHTVGLVLLDFMFANSQFRVLTFPRFFFLWMLKFHIYFPDELYDKEMKSFPYSTAFLKGVSIVRSYRLQVARGLTPSSVLSYKCTSTAKVPRVMKVIDNNHASALWGRCISEKKENISSLMNVAISMMVIWLLLVIGN